jgi:hypothetical protein
MGIVQHVLGMVKDGGRVEQRIQVEIEIPHRSLLHLLSWSGRKFQLERHGTDSSRLRVAGKKMFARLASDRALMPDGASQETIRMFARGRCGPNGARAHPRISGARDRPRLRRPTEQENERPRHRFP